MNEEFFSLIPKLKRKCCSVLKVQGTFRKKRIVGVYDDEDPPVPISNTVVKLVGAEDTWLETTRENKTMPTFSLYYAPLAQLVEQLTLNQWVLGSNPRWCTKLYSSIAQSVEHLTVNQGVTGSSPVGGAKKFRSRK